MNEPSADRVCEEQKSPQHDRTKARTHGFPDIYAQPGSAGAKNDINRGARTVGLRMDSKPIGVVCVCAF